MLRSGCEARGIMRIFGICCEASNYLHLILVGIMLIATHTDAYTDA